MRFSNVAIESFAHFVPDSVITSAAIEDKLSPIYDRLRLPFGRLELMTGIKERRHWDDGTKPSFIATNAGKLALAKSKIDPNDIGVLVHASVCRDFLEPATASVVHQQLGLDSSCMIFDLSNACLGVLNSFVVVANMIEQGSIKHGLIVSGENGGPLLSATLETLLNDTNLNRKNIKKYIANLTIGSAGVAYILSHKDFAPEAPQIVGGAVLTDSSANQLCQGDGNTHSLMMETDSEELMKAGVKLATKTWNETKKNLEWHNDSPALTVGHQVGIAHEKLMMDSLELAHIPTYATYPHFGNTGSAALPLTLSMAAHENKIQKDDLIALLGIGSGLSSIMLGVKW